MRVLQALSRLRNKSIYQIPLTICSVGDDKSPLRRMDYICTAGNLGLCDFTTTDKTSFKTHSDSHPKEPVGKFRLPYTQVLSNDLVVKICEMIPFVPPRIFLSRTDEGTVFCDLVLFFAF
jgi:hypothetical protein